MVAIEELQDLKGVWSELKKIWEKVDELREKPWLSVAPRKVRQELDQLLQQLKAFPARLKTYSSYEYAVQLLKSYTKVRTNWGFNGLSQGLCQRKELSLCRRLLHCFIFLDGRVV